MNDPALFALAQSGNKAASDKLVSQNMGLVVRWANMFQNDLVPFDDRVQEGVIGLLKAIQSYDPSQGFTFSTYATPKIHHEIRRAIQNADTVRVPVCQQDGRYDLSQAAANFRNMADIDGEIGEDGDTLAAIIGAADAGYADVDFRSLLAPLTDREREVLMLRYAMGETLQEIGDRFGFSRQRTHQIHGAALTKLRDALPAAA
jgi:RNA polymerase sigma factor (sigma-70 family)